MKNEHVKNTIKDNFRTCFRIFNACRFETTTTSVEDPEINSGIMPSLNNTPSSALRASYPSRGEEYKAWGLSPLEREGGRSGFTLIELLVVILIIGILTAIALPQYQKAVYRSRNTALKHYVRTIYEAEELYYLNNGKYAVNFGDLDISLPLTPIQTSVNRNQPPCSLVTGGTESILQGKDFQVIINRSSYNLAKGTHWILGYWTAGPYKCAGFAKAPALFDKKLVCWEARNTTYKNAQGAFCDNIENATLIPGQTAAYALP